jgi:hypothetical protein
MNRMRGVAPHVVSVLLALLVERMLLVSFLGWLAETGRPVDAAAITVMIIITGSVASAYWTVCVVRGSFISSTETARGARIAGSGPAGPPPDAPQYSDHGAGKVIRTAVGGAPAGDVRDANRGRKKNRRRGARARRRCPATP